MCKFKRSVTGIVLSTLLLIQFIILCIGAVLSSSLILLLLCPLFVVVSLTVSLIMPPDFEYTIRLSNDGVIFEFFDEDYRKISKNFSIIRRTGRYIVLYDGFSRMRIPYNEEVIQFLDEIKN